MGGFNKGEPFCFLHSEIRSCVFGKEACKEKNQNEQPFPIGLDALSGWESP
jgi:hypothetical protein